MPPAPFHRVHRAARLREGDEIGIVRGDDHQAIARKGRQHGAHRSGAGGIEIGGGFIEQQDRPARQDRAGQAQPAAFAPGEAGAAMVERGVQPIAPGEHGAQAQAFEQGVHRRVACGWRAAERQIVTQAAGQQRHGLPGPAHGGVERAGLERARRPEDLTLRQRGLAHQREQQRRLAAAGGAGHRVQAGAGPVPRQRADARAIGIGDHHVLATQTCRGGHRWRRIGQRGHGCIERLQRGFAGLLVVIGGREAAHPEVEFGRQRQGVEGAGQGQVFRRGEGQQAQEGKAAIDRHQRHAERREEFENGVGGKGDGQDRHGAARHILRRAGKLAADALFRAARHDQRQVGDAIDEQARSAGQRRMLRPRPPRGEAPGQHQAEHERHQRGEHDHGGNPACRGHRQRDQQGRGRAGAAQGQEAGDKAFGAVDRVHSQVRVFAHQRPARHAAGQQRRPQRLAQAGLEACGQPLPCQARLRHGQARAAPPSTSSAAAGHIGPWPACAATAQARPSAAGMAPRYRPATTPWRAASGVGAGQADERRR
jgi:hypothetical protein